MWNAASDKKVTARVHIWSGRQLLVDCLSHHFSTVMPHFEVVTDALENIDASVPTVCIRDVSRQSYDDLEKEEIVAEIRRTAPHARILIFSARPAEEEAPGWIAAGAHGFFSTRSTQMLLTAAAVVVAAGGLFIPEDLARNLLSFKGLDGE